MLEGEGRRAVELLVARRAHSDADEADLKALEKRVNKHVSDQLLPINCCGSVAVVAVFALILYLTWQFKSDITALQKDIEAIKADSVALRADRGVYALKTDIDAIRGDNNNLAANVATLPSNETVQAEIKAATDALRADNQKATDALNAGIEAIKAHDVTDKAELDRLSDAVRLMAELDKSAWQHTREAILSDSNTTMTQKVARVEEVDAKMKQLRKRLVA
ncbi:unnamed protein product [Vitrella brassicaformis CCMP3155]|uniref:Uncharacterized protein n=1 Tax=Vitrella brassicaformis (strain CCMP3155) TaxID=1169540 RepID=A0A0G4ENU3_VITBC|nr:unnamed protein product [Vitrella brassicaformis CCMP3155]|eukprot:CEL98823.1 unnamed protein product [Vitrella brassicaformis CCMP3155]